MGDGAAIFGVLIFLLAMLVTGTLVGAVVLRAAVSLYNKMTGGVHSPKAVSEPPMGKAIGIMFVTTLINAAAGFVLGLAMPGARGGGVNVVAQLASLLISVLVMATMLYAMLPTTFGRALLVALCALLIAVVIVGGVVLVWVLGFH